MQLRKVATALPIGLLAIAGSAGGCDGLLGVQTLTFTPGDGGADVLSPQAGDGGKPGQDAGPSQGGNDGGSGNPDATVSDAGTDAPSMTCPGNELACGTSCVNPTTDGNNCGTCGHVCGTGSACGGGQCSAVALCTYSNGDPVNTDNTGQLVLIGTTAYWTPSLEPTDGGAETIAATLSCDTSAAPVIPPPQATTVFGETRISGGTGISRYTDTWVPAGVITGDSTLAYWLVGATFNSSLIRLESMINWSDPSGISPEGGANFETDYKVGYGFGDPSSTQGIYFYQPGNPSLFRGGIGADALSCVTRTGVGPTDAGGSVDDGVAANATVLVADDTLGVLLTTTASSSGCTNLTTIATGTGAEDSVALSSDGSVFATEVSGYVYVCATATGCAKTLSTPATALSSSLAAASNQGSTGGTGNGYGMVFDHGSLANNDLNLYWIGSTGLVRCPVAMSNGVGSCSSMAVLSPASASLKPTSGLAVDSKYVYALEAGTLYRFAK